MKRQRRTIGAILKIPLQDGTHCYGLVLDKASMAVFKVKTTQDLQITDILSKDVLFIIAVYDDVITSGKWEKIGKTTLDERFINLPMKFIQDQLNPNLIQLYNPNTGEIKLSTKEDCVDLDRAAVWDAGHVEERVLDFFNGRKNVWVEQQRLK
jgi:hypothetical protein